jgi:alkaline phosphatase D
MAQNSPTSISHGNGSLSFNSNLAPFFWGVASGDPTPNSVLIWTRVDTEQMLDWRVATDPQMQNIIQQGQVFASASRDNTAKVNITALNADTYYYYSFKTQNGIFSLTGRMKTAPSGNNANVKLAIVSCSNYMAGYFNAYKNLSRINDLDAVVHLGDYIYEYAEGEYGYSTEIGRGHQPQNEIISLSDYRTRYNFHRLDPDLIRAHQQHTFIAVWDDHESANDSYVDGAENHTPATEGDWYQRKANSKQAYFEWMPINDNQNQSVYRKFTYGNLVDLFMVDTRLEGRTIQPDSMAQADYNAPERTILGQTQKDWLTQELQNSTAKWKLIGNQVIFSRIIIDVLRMVDSRAEGLFLDTWQGYPYERAQIENLFDNTNNVVVLTGDIHTGIGFDITKSPSRDTTIYNPRTGLGSIAVEFVCPSITSPNFNELVAANLVPLLQQILQGENPHAKYANLVDHGYTLIDVTPQRVQADWVYMDTIKVSNENGSIKASWFTADGENYLQQANTSALPKPMQAIQAPDDPQLPTGIFAINEVDKNILAFCAPNPAFDFSILNIITNTSEKVDITILSSEGKKVKYLFGGIIDNGLTKLPLNISNLSKGKYLINIQTEKGFKQIPFIKL